MVYSSGRWLHKSGVGPAILTGLASGAVCFFVSSLLQGRDTIVCVLHHAMTVQGLRDAFHTKMPITVKPPSLDPRQGLAREPHGLYEASNKRLHALPCLSRYQEAAKCKAESFAALESPSVT